MSKELRTEIRQRRPFRTLEQEAYLNIVRTAAQLTDSFEQMLGPWGITSSQFNVLRILQGAEPAGLCRNDVRDRMLTRMPDMTRLLDRMEKAGLVSRQRSTEDRRLVSTRITPKGTQLVQDLEASVIEEHRARLGHLSTDELDTLIDLLSKARASG